VGEEREGKGWKGKGKGRGGGSEERGKDGKAGVSPHIVA